MSYTECANYSTSEIGCQEEGMNRTRGKRLRSLYNNPVQKVKDEERAAVLARLWQEFERLNTAFFDGDLRLREIRLSPRKQYGGYYRKSDSLIVLSWQAYQEHGWEETLNTFRHEVAHIVYQDHSRAFWALADKLGCTRRHALSPKERNHAYCRYVYECPVCQAKLYRRKRIVKASCGRCDKVFNPAYQLRLVSSTTTRNAAST
jgi:predicted SprT family Zn-dependent metalloprotease